MKVTRRSGGNIRNKSELISVEIQMRTRYLATVGSSTACERPNCGEQVSLS